MCKFRQTVVLLLLALLLMSAGSAAAEEALFWPVERDLQVKIWSHNDVQTWGKIGDVRMWNTKDKLFIHVKPQDCDPFLEGTCESNELASTDYKIEQLNIHIVLDKETDFPYILNTVGKPVPGKFTYQIPFAPAVDEYTFELDLHADLGICWGVDPAICPNIRYIIVHADLARYDDLTGQYENIGEGAFCYGDGDFLRLDKAGVLEEEGIEWGWYNSYPMAKVETGHFVDDKVKGLTYQTPTQSGTSGDSGNFDYIPDERVTFTLGDLYIGSALGNRNVTPYDLYYNDIPMTEGQALNVAWLLQNLDADGMADQGPINISAEVIGCLNAALEAGTSPGDFSNDTDVKATIDKVKFNCSALEPPLASVTKEEALANLNWGQKSENIVKKNVSKTPGLKSDKAKLEIMPVYVPAQKADGTLTDITYFDADGIEKETRSVAKPLVVAYLDEVAGTGASDVFVAVSRDDGDTWKRRNISKTADKSSKLGYPGKSEKPMLKVKDNMIFVAWTDKYCRGGRPGYAIEVCPDTTGDGLPDPCEVCRTQDGVDVCTPDYPGDDAFYAEDLYGVGGPQRSVVYDATDYPDLGEVPYSCVWTARGVVDPVTGATQWFKPERLTSGRRDAYQLFAGAGEDVAFAIVWQEDPKGLMPGEGDGPGEGWSGANTNNKTDIWYSYITLSDFDLIDPDYPTGGNGDGDLVDTDPELAGRAKALVPMSLPVKISDNDICSYENMLAEGGGGEHDTDGEGEGTHRYCGTTEGIGTAEAPGSNPLCAYTVEKTNPKGEVHNVCVTADGRLLDGNTGASRPNIFLQPYKKSDGTKSAWAIIGYEESKGVGIPPDGEHDDGCGGEETLTESVVTTEEPEDRYKPDIGKNVIYHSFDFTQPDIVGGGGIINLPETDEAGNLVYLKDETGAPLLDWKGDQQLDYENARRVRFITQPKSKAGPSKTVLVALYRQGKEGSGKPADIFMRRVVAPSTGNPYAFGNFVDGAQNLSSVTPTLLWTNPLDPEAPEKMLRWSWAPANLLDKSAANPRDDARAHRGSLNGDELIVGYSWTPNWGRRANDKYDFLIRRSFNGGQAWTTDPAGGDITHNVVYRNPVIVTDEETGEPTLAWEEEVVPMTFAAGASERPRNVSNLRNYRTSVLEPRLVKTPGTITNPDGSATAYAEDIQDTAVYQLAYGLEFNQNMLPDGVVYPQTPLDIFYSRTRDKGQNYETMIVTPGGGSGKPEEGWGSLANDKPQQGAAQLRQTPDGSRMYGIWLEESEDKGSDIMFRRVDYVPVTEPLP